MYLIVHLSDDMLESVKDKILPPQMGVLEAVACEAILRYLSRLPRRKVGKTTIRRCPNFKCRNTDRRRFGGLPDKASAAVPDYIQDRKNADPTVPIERCFDCGAVYLNQRGHAALIGYWNPSGAILMDGWHPSDIKD